MIYVDILRRGFGDERRRGEKGVVICGINDLIGKKEGAWVCRGMVVGG